MKHTLWVRVLCWILAILMLGSVSTYIIHTIISLL